MSLMRFAWLPLLAMLVHGQTVTLSSNPNPSAFAQNVTLTASVGSGATGRVTFYDGVAVLGTGVVSNGQAVLKAPFLLPGAHSLRARYDGDTTHAAASSATFSQAVNPSTALGFGLPVGSAVSGALACLVQGDFNGDGIPDLAAGAAATTSVLLGNGDGTFRAGQSYPVGCPLVVGDFNGDGIQDLAAGSGNVLLGEGDGTFQSVAAPAIAGSWIVASDFDGDGITDLAAGSGATISVLVGRQDGTFQQKASYSLASAVTAMVSGDFNGDGAADLAVFGTNVLDVLFGNGDGSLQNPVMTSTASYPPNGNVATADFNGDGKLDLVTVGGSPGSTLGTGCTVYLGNGDGTFQPVLAFGGVSLTYRSYDAGVAVADLNGDGKPDLMFLFLNTIDYPGSVETMTGNGDGTFQASGSYTGLDNMSSMIAGDFNGDGIPDVAVISGGISPPNIPPGVYAMFGAVANLGVSITSSGNFIVGQTATVSITVSNGTGVTASGGLVTVTPNLPADLTETSISGTGWTCSGTCTRSDSLAPGASYPPIVMGVSVGATSDPSFTVQATVSGGGSPSATGTEIIPKSNLPGTPTLTTPANGAQIAASQVQLAWSAGSNATSEDLYLGTASPPPLLLANVPSNPYSPAGLLAGITYYWQIVARNSSGSSPSAIGSFSTLPMCASVTPSGVEIGPSAQSGTLAISAPAGCAWTATTNVPWITITSAAGTGNGQVAFSVSANSGLPRIGSITVQGTTATVTQDAEGLGFVTVTPCRVADTRGAAGSFGGPSMAAGQTRTFQLPASTCGIPSTAQAYSLNITVAPRSMLSYMTVWPAGQTQPLVSTLNSYNGAIVANAAIVPAGAAGAINVYVTDATDVIIDINGYFASANTAGALVFYPVTPCRVADTRAENGTFGGPALTGGQTRAFPVTSSSCGIPSSARAYSLNMTAVPPGPLGYLTAWPTGVSQPVVSTLNALNGQIVANAAIVPAGTNGNISVFVSDPANVVIDINGYFAPPGQPGSLYFYPVTPCRLVDTRTTAGTFGGPWIAGETSRNFPLSSGSCGLSSRTAAYSLNITVIPPGPLTYLTAWPAGQSQPLVSTLNSLLGAIVANAALVPAGSAGAISVFVSNTTDLVIDVNGYFAQ